MGNTCTNCSQCKGDMGESNEVLTVDNKVSDQVVTLQHGTSLTPEQKDYYMKHIRAVIFLQSWSRGVITRERIRAHLQEFNPHQGFQQYNHNNAMYGAAAEGHMIIDGDPNFNMNDVDESQLEQKGEVFFKNGATYTG